MKTQKKIVSFLLAVVMICSTVAFADPPAEPYISGYALDATFNGSINWGNYHNPATPAEVRATLTKYVGGVGNSEIVRGDYADLTLTVVDAGAAALDFSASCAVSIPSDSNFGGDRNLQASITKTTSDGTDSGTVTGYKLALKGLNYINNSGNVLKVLVTQGSYNAVLSCTVENATIVPTGTVTPPVVDIVSAQPYVIISSYSYGKGDLVAGESRNVTMTFSNTSQTMAVENMMVTMTLPADAMMLTSSSNSFYIEHLEAGKSITKTVNVSVKPTATVESHSISVNFTYDYMDGVSRRSATTEETISMPVVQVDRFTVTGVEIGDYLFANEEGGLSVGFVNKGRSDVYNISAKLSCAGVLNDGEEQYLGNLASGSTSSADFYITPLESGALTGEVIITYEDTNMQERTVNVPFTADVTSYEEMYGPMDPGFEDPGMMEPGFEEPGMITSGVPWYWIALGVAAVGGIVAFAVVRGRKKKASEVEDEDI